jgi:deazaflavin-dependent oxidoreductase (nitroreductase family)
LSGQTVRERFLRVLKHTLNPVTVRLARSRYGPFSLIRHVGRKSGRVYETPLILARVPEGFIAELTYGDHVDWYRNSIAGGSVVVHHGTEFPVTRIETCPAERGRSAYPAPFRSILKATGRSEFRLLHTDGGGS